tara:strand:+ start:455 stop:913 length:459 start_codon:yes stop_codon:yes gene_type:complete
MLRKLDNALARMAEKVTIVDPVFRLSISLIFMIGGLGHFFAHQHMLGRMHLSPWRSYVELVGNPSVLLWLSGAIFIAAGITLALGWMTRISAAVLFLTLVPITVAIHVAPGHTGPLFKNVAILGSLIFLFVRGPGRWALARQPQPFNTPLDR